MSAEESNTQWEQEESFLDSLGELEDDFYKAYEGKGALTVLPYDLTDLMEAYSEGEEGEETPHANEKPKLDYGLLYEDLNSPAITEGLNMTVTIAGIKARAISRYGQAVPPELFVWGYNLYFGIMHRADGVDLPLDYDYDNLFGTPDSFDPEPWVNEFAENARSGATLLWKAADSMLDKLIEVRAGKLKTREHLWADFERDQIRAERLLVMRAGVGFSLRHWQKIYADCAPEADAA